MALTYYETQVQRLLQNPKAPSTLYATSDLDSWINTARGQLAGEAECIRVLGTLNTVVGTDSYFFQNINIGVPATTGIDGVINVRSIMYVIGAGRQWIAPHPWPWFQLYYVNNPVPVQGPPETWAQYGQGASSNGGASTSGAVSASTAGGLFVISPPPDAVYTLVLDCVCYPLALVNDATPEAIPYLWTDAVPFFAAWYALLSSQMQARRADAEAYFNYYQTFMQRARQFANPSVGRSMYEQAADPVAMNKLGNVQRAGNGQG